MTQETEQAAQPSIIIEFKEKGSAECMMHITDCSPFQLWGAARMLDQYAEDAWQAAQMKQAMAQAQAQMDSPKVTPMDHMRARKGRN